MLITCKKNKPVIQKVTIELSSREAVALKQLLGRVGGTFPKFSIVPAHGSTSGITFDVRPVTDEIYRQLHVAGVPDLPEEE